MEVVTYPAVVTEGPAGTRIDFPDLPDAGVVDADPGRARLRAEIGLAIIISDLQSHYEPVPAPSPLAKITVPVGGRLIEVATDLDRY